MKKYVVVLGLSAALMFFLTSCKPKVDNEKEIQAIKSVINAETQAWIDRNPEKMKEFYIHDALQTRVNIQDSVYTIATGWEKRSVAIDTLAKYADWKGVDAFKVEKEYLAIKVSGDAAWAVLKETQNMVYNGSPATAVSIINVMLEKVDKNWKISCFVKSSI
ncbi:MAG TPA: nuclear transport factor 2 family protein [Bacteroidales bacterium]|nr:nuclear transport factor 2 family protein [Bacteroidales bacterium]